MFFNNCNWCRCWSQCKSCNSNNNCQNKDRKYHDKKCCYVEQSHDYGTNDCCHKSNNDYYGFAGNYSPSNQSFDYDRYSNFRYYDQYGSFNNFDNNCRDDIEDKFEHCKLCKPSHNKCQPTKFICFPVDRY